MRTRFLAVVLTTFAVTLSARQSGSPQPSTQPSPRFEMRTEAVVVDVSVTDRKGRPVTTLTQSDFEVFEDDAPQTVLTFEHHAAEPGAAVSNAASAAGLTGGSHPPGRNTGPLGPSVTALAFDRLSPEGRNLAYRAAKRFVQNKQADELAGVFIVDQALSVLAPYTTDTAVLRAALQKAAETATTQLARERNPGLEMLHVSPDTPMVASAEDQGRSDTRDLPHSDPVALVGKEDPMRAAIFQMLLKMERSYNDMLYEMQGHASLDSLLALVDSLGAVPGRKAVIYFCEGLTIPASLEARFRAIIHTANRSNVTVYTVDAGGLRVHSDQATTAQAVQEYGAMGVGDIERRGKYLDALEDNARTLTKDPAVSLGILANQTGGLLINNTNDLENGIGRIDDDRRNYYLLGYSPTNPALDGSFRKISVRVKTPGLEVRARSGYVAAPDTSVAPVFDYELPALRAFEAIPRPDAFPFQLVAASVPMPGRPGMAALSVTVPGSSLSLLGDQKTDEYVGGAVVVARVRDAQGGVVRKLSQQFRLRGAMTNAPSVKDKTLTFARFPDLDPGSYQVDVAIYDSAGDRASVATLPLTIPEFDVPVVGDLLIVDHAERVPADAPATGGNPLVLNGLLLKPVIGPTIHAGTASEVHFALALSLVPGAASPPVSLSLFSPGGEVLASVRLVLGQPEPSGRLLAVGRVPLAAIPPGRYDLRVTVGTGSEARTRKAALTVIE